MAEDWQILAHREDVDILTVAYLEEGVYWQIKPFQKTNEQTLFTYCANRSFTHYLSISKDELGRYIFQKYFGTIKQIVEFCDFGKEYLATVEGVTSRWRRSLTEDISLLPSALDDFDKYYSYINDMYNMAAFVAIEAWQGDFNTLVTDLIKKNNLTNEKDSIFSSLYKPWKNTALIEIQDKLKKGVSAKVLAKDYQFMRSWSVIWNKPLEEDWFLGLGVQDKTGLEKAYSVEEIYKMLNASTQEKSQLELAPYVIYLKDWRDDLRRKHIYLWYFLWETVAKYLDTPIDDLGYLTLPEIKECVKNHRADQEKIAWRKTNPIIITCNLPLIKTVTIESDIPSRYIDAIAEVKNKTKGKVVKGLVAQPGKVIGVVQIINSYHDIKKFKPGMVLVANTTHPNYLPAMQQAVAIVTNEGGIISHAAIVARELKKPCIVGTKTATQILKDGDEIEVDANLGTVKIIREK